MEEKCSFSLAKLLIQNGDEKHKFVGNYRLCDRHIGSGAELPKASAHHFADVYVISDCRKISFGMCAKRTFPNL